MSLKKKLVYASKVLPRATWRALRPASRGHKHLIIAMADHFEPAIVPEDGTKRAPHSEQERRLEWWSREYPAAVDRWRDNDGRPFVHTYFYPAEQYDEGLVQTIAEHCHAGWGEMEVHLHHGITEPDTAENMREMLVNFRDKLAIRHRCLAMEGGSEEPRYAFVHGNFALANSSGGRFCGVDSEMQVLAETGCYADFTLPAGRYHPAQTAKINSIYECALPLEHAAPHREGRDLRVGVAPRTYPLMVQGPLVTDWKTALRSPGQWIESSAITGGNPMSLRRLALWKQADITVQDRPDWLFIKLHCHGMDPTQKDAVIGPEFQNFLAALVGGAELRNETLHFVTAREMTNLILAACDGRDGNPNEYRNYRFKQISSVSKASEKWNAPSVAMKG